MARTLSFGKAIWEATDQCLAADPSVYLMGLGVPDPGGIFGTTTALREKHGANRVLDMPVAENGMTGIAIGSAIMGMRPVMTHQRVDFALLAMEQLVNQAAKWHYMFAGQARVPLVVRLVIGRGWGQGPQHSQSLHSWFAHIPGLKVVAPFSPRDAKGLLAAAIRDDNPVVYLEHRWLHNIADEVPEELYETPIGKARIVRQGADVTLAAFSHMTYECLRAAEMLEQLGVQAEVVDLRSLRPLDSDTLLASVRKTGRLVAAESDWSLCGVAGELVALAAERAFADLKAAPVRVTLPDHPLPTAPSLSKDYYPTAGDIAAAALSQLGRADAPHALLYPESPRPHDVPDLSFKGPF
ncbi:alpha-ketoacid dehydrogenase subunit beta [Humidesulfovibrio idahonensis]